jgi:hypothetical protein
MEISHTLILLGLVLAGVGVLIHSGDGLPRSVRRLPGDILIIMEVQQGRCLAPVVRRERG